MEETQETVSIPGLGISSERGNNPLQDSCLGNPLDRGSWQATVHGVAKSQTQLSTHTLSAVLNMTHGVVGGSLAICPLVTRGFGEGKESPQELGGQLSEGGGKRPPSRAPGSPGAGVGTATRRAVPAGTLSSR